MEFNNIVMYSLGDIFTFWMPGASASPSYLIKAISGLGPPDYSVTITPKRDLGGTFQNSKPESRELVFRIGLNPNYGLGETVGSLRTALYSLVGNSVSTKILFKDDADVVVNTSGYITKFEVVPFAKDPEVQITILCPNSYFEKNTVVLTSLAIDAETGKWIFPNIGTVPCGFKLSVVLGLDATSWYLRLAPLSPGFELSYPLLTAGDILTLDTRDGSKDIRLKHGTDPEYSLLFAVTSILWLTPLPGGSVFFMPNQSTTTIQEYRYTPLYMGF